MISSSLLLALSCLKQAIAAPYTSTSTTAFLTARDGTGSVASSAGLAWYDINLSVGTSGRSNPSSYTCFSGPASNFPARSSWISFDAMWALQIQDALTPIGDSAAEQQAIYNAVLAVSSNAKVDPRVILAVIVDESTGNVRVPCTTSYGGVHNCGLMQAYNSSAYDSANMQTSITRMVIDGTQGTAYGPGLVQLFNDAADTSTKTSGNLYSVLRAYNSGKINAAELSDGQGATPAYVSNIANYLQGWNGWGNGPASCSFPNTTPAPSPTPSPAPALTCASTAYVAPPAPTVAGTTPNCCTWHTVASGENCYTIDNAYNITLAQVRLLNTYIDAACDNLWGGYAYCMFGNVAGSTVVSSSQITVATTIQTKLSTSSAYTSTRKSSSSSVKAISSGAKVVVLQSLAKTSSATKQTSTSTHKTTATSTRKSVTSTTKKSTTSAKASSTLKA